ncbi:MAG: hypothetical protein ACOYL8_04605 [Patescibacteria group bacterium]
MKTKADLVYQDLKIMLANKVFSFSEEPSENYRILDEQVGRVNLAKCGLKDLDLEQPYTSLYLAHLLQSEKNVPFGLCPDFKMWFNQYGYQARCRQNVGPVNVRCNAILSCCPKKKALV